MASRVFVVRGHEMDDSYTYGFGSAASSSPASSTSLTCCGAAAPGMVVMCWVYGSGGSGATPYYPGDSYVDWIGIGPYDPKLLKGSPTATYQPFITYLNGVSFGHGKPLGIFETGVDQPPPNTDKAAAAWIDDVPACLAALKTTYGSKYQLWQWFNSSGSLGDTAIPPGSLSATALANIGASSLFNLA